MTERSAAAAAELLVSGTGAPRTRGEIVREVAAALMSAFNAGVSKGQRDQRAIALSEAKSAIDGAVQALSAARSRMDSAL